MTWLRENVPALGSLQELKAFLERAFTALEADLLRTNGISLDDGILVQSCTGTPEGAITAPVGSMCLRTDGGAGTVLYVKESGTGNTGWVAK